MSSKNSGELTLYPETKYWVYVLQYNHWEHLIALFKKNKFFISSFKKYAVNKNDIIFVYQKHKATTKTGFVAVCQTSQAMTFNTGNKIKIFKDMNMNKHCVELSMVSLFNDPYRISQVDKLMKPICEDFKVNSFRTNNLKECSTFSEIKKNVGRSLLDVLVKLFDETDDTSDIDSDTSCNNSDSESESKEESSEESDDDEVLMVDGHIPILMIPCPDFEWNKDSDITIKNLKKHYKFCSTCDKTDNNNTSILPALHSSEI